MIESQSSPNIIPSWWEEHKRNRSMKQKERTQEEKERIAAESDRMLAEYLGGMHSENNRKRFTS